MISAVKYPGSLTTSSKFGLVEISPLSITHLEHQVPNTQDL